MMESRIVQRLKVGGDRFVLSERYYSILSAVNDLRLTQREVQLLAFTAVKGSMSFANVRDEFCKRYSTTGPTINNMVSKMKRIGLLTKMKGKIRVNPLVQLDFSKDVILQIRMVHEEA